MGAFFHDWRRKAGCLTLVVASVLTAAWIRSFVCDDFLTGWITRHSIFGIISSNSSISLRYAWDDGGEANATTVNGATVIESLWDSTKLVDWQSIPVEDEPVDDIGWDWVFCGLSFASHDYEPIHERAIGVSNFYFVIPLTLISAFLLLSKPHQPTQKRVAEPASNERGATT